MAKETQKRTTRQTRVTKIQDLSARRTAEKVTGGSPTLYKVCTTGRHLTS
jgi:hypothetical protein